MKLLSILLNVVFGPEVTIPEGGLIAVQFLAQSCISLVTKPILVPFLDSVTLIAATDVPMELVLIHKSPVNGLHVVVPVGKGDKKLVPPG